MGIGLMGIGRRCCPCRSLWGGPSGGTNTHKNDDPRTIMFLDLRAGDVPSFRRYSSNSRPAHARDELAPFYRLMHAVTTGDLTENSANASVGVLPSGRKDHRCKTPLHSYHVRLSGRVSEPPPRNTRTPPTMNPHSHHDASGRGPSRLIGLGAVVLGCLLVIGCSGDGDVAPPAWVHGASAPRYGPAVSGPCEDGARRFCSVTFEQANGIHSCWQGVQYCVEGLWSACGDLSDAPDLGLGGAGGAAAAD